MKKIKYILFTAVILSFFFITACSTTQSVPQDDVYYSTTPHVNVTAKTTTANAVSSTVTKQQKAKQADNAGYRQGKVENISQPSGQTTSGDKYDVNYSSQLKRFHQSNDTTLNYSTDRTVQDSSRQSKTTTIIVPNVSYNLGFESPYFGSSWSFGFGSSYGWNTGFGYGWGFPSYGWGGGYGWGFPSYGWGYPGYGWGYSNYAWGYPGYGWGGGYYDLGYAGWGGGYYSPYYTGWGGGYYSPYLPGYIDNGRRGGIYQPRINRGGGSSVRATRGGSGVYTKHGAKSATRNADIPGTVSRKRVPVNPRGLNGKMLKPNGNNSRPAGSMRYNAAMAKKRLEDIQRRGRLNKPGGNAIRRGADGGRSAKFGISESRNRAAEGYRKPPAYRREENMSRPRFQKPKQYQSLESRSTRSSKEFYRAPARPSNPEYRRAGTRTGTRTVYPRQRTIRRQNVYRSEGPRNSVYRSRRTRSGTRVNNAPSRSRSFFSPNNFRAPARSNSSISRPTRSFSAPTRSFSAPTRSRTTSGSGGGGIRRSSGSGGIRR